MATEPGLLAAGCFFNFFYFLYRNSQLGYSLVSYLDLGDLEVKVIGPNPKPYRQYSNYKYPKPI